MAASQRQRVPNIGASSSACTSTSSRRGGLEEALHVLEREAVRRPERQHDAVLECRGLELEVELAAEALAQRQSPGPVDARAVGRVDDEVGVAHVVEEALEHDGVERRQRAEREPGRRRGSGRAAGPRPASSCCLVAQPALRGLPVRRRRRSSASSRRRETAAESSSLRAGASPNQNGSVGAMAARVLDEHLVHLDLLHAVRGVAELEDVAGHALEREVLADRADAQALRVQHDVVVELVRDHAGVGHGREPRAAPRAQPRG